MFSVSGHAIRKHVFVLGVFEALVIYGAMTALSAFALLITQDAGPSGSVMLFSALIMLFMLALGAYEPDARSHLSVMTERLSIACILGAGMSFLIIYVFQRVWISPLFAIAGAAAPYLAVSGARYVAGRVTRVRAFTPRILVLGAGERLEETRRILTGPGVTGALAAVVSAEEAEADGRLLETVKRHDIGEIVVTLDRRETLPARALLDCKMAGVQITDYVAFHERETGKVDLENTYAGRFIFSEGGSHSVWSRNVKRAFDVTVSLTALTLGAPLLVLTMLLIRLDSPGPVFYRQTRVGWRGESFEILKFRSMRTDAEKHGAQWAKENDDRITRVGRFIRKTRIDELPQLINILKGDMSIVGPRPERPVFVDRLKEIMPYYGDRHRVKPGLTGWAQINYPYGASDEDAREKLTYDLYYMKNCSLFLDVIILLKTARVVLWPDGVR